MEKQAMAKIRPTKERSGIPRSRTALLQKAVKTLAIDIGATRIKASTLNELGEIVTKRVFTDTPRSGMPGAVMDIIAKLADAQPEYDRISVGFPGIVQNGVVQAAPNLAPEWKHFNIGKILAARLRKPVRVANDADVQGFGAISGVGVEMVLTLGTGVGSALFLNGHLVPNVEVGKDKLSNAELKRVGKRKWNKRLQKLIRKLEAMFYYDRLYIGGGNSKAVSIPDIPANVTIVSNLNGMAGGVALWRELQRPE
jgi:polyphosphate glucokinase